MFECRRASPSSSTSSSKGPEGMPHLIRLSLKTPPSETAPYPFSVPQVRTLPELDVNTGVTFFVGENGSGKSTLLEGIAAAAELHARGSADNLISINTTTGAGAIISSS